MHFEQWIKDLPAVLAGWGQPGKAEVYQERGGETKALVLYNYEV